MWYVMSKTQIITPQVLLWVEGRGLLKDTYCSCKYIEHNKNKDGYDRRSFLLGKIDANLGVMYFLLTSVASWLLYCILGVLSAFSSVIFA